MEELSVIVPVYNAEPYLETCVGSLRRLRIEGLEILLIDDGSDDGSLALCRRMAALDARIRVFSQENAGLVRTRKRGAALARGRYLAFVDADDWINAEAYASLFQEIRETRCDLLLFGLTEERETGGAVKRNLVPEGVYAGKDADETIRGRVISTEIFFRLNVHPSLSGKIAARENYLRAQNSVPDEITVGEDFAFTCQLLKNARRIQVSAMAPYHYRRHAGSMMDRPLPQRQAAALLRSLRPVVSGPQLGRYALWLMARKYFDVLLREGEALPQLTARRIALYGAGEFGQEVYAVLERRSPGTVVWWGDAGWEAYRRQGLPVCAPENFSPLSCDDVFIAILDEEICRQVADKLAAAGMAAEAIGWLRPTKALTDFASAYFLAEQ